ncbi:MAG: VOC family protein [Myxococcota bacterium]
MFGSFQLCGQWFAAMDSAQADGFVFNEAISLLVDCQTQQEMDRAGLGGYPRIPRNQMAAVRLVALVIPVSGWR